MFPKYLGDYYGSFVFEEVVKLVENENEIHVITQHNSGIPYEEVMEGIHVHRFKWLKPKKFKALVHFTGFIDYLRLITYLFSLFFSLMILMKRYDFDVIHAHSVIPTGFIASIVSKLFNKPLIITVHGMDINNFLGNFLMLKLIVFSLNLSNNIITVSKDLYEKIIQLGVDKDKIIILRNAIDIKRFKPKKNKQIRKKFKIDPEDKLILFVGYLDKFKGIFEVVESFNILKSKYKNLKLMFVGKGPKKMEIQKIVSKNKMEDDVIFTGQVKPKKIQDYYQAADFFVLPSYSEGGGPPLVVLEAMGCGIPVVVSDVGGIPEVLEDGKNCFLVPPQNIEILTEKLGKLIEDEELSKKFSIKSVELVRNYFDINKKIIKLLKIYGEIS